jgi:hypothetical protein
MVQHPSEFYESENDGGDLAWASSQQTAERNHQSYQKRTAAEIQTPKTSRASEDTNKRIKMEESSGQTASDK